MSMVTTSSRLVLHTCKYQAHSKLSKVPPHRRTPPPMFPPYTKNIHQPGLKVPSISCMYRTFPCPV